MIRKLLKTLLIGLSAGTLVMEGGDSLWYDIKFIEKAQAHLPKNDTVSLIMEDTKTLVEMHSDEIIRRIFDCSYVLRKQAERLQKEIDGAITSDFLINIDELKKLSKIQQQALLAQWAKYNFMRTINAGDLYTFIESLDILDSRKSSVEIFVPGAGISGCTITLPLNAFRLNILASLVLFNLLLDENIPQELLNEFYDTRIFKDKVRDEVDCYLESHN